MHSLDNHEQHCKYDGCNVALPNRILFSQFRPISMQLLMPSLVLQAELHNVRSQLLSDFTPDDMCPMSTQFFEAHTDNPSSGPHETGHHQEVCTSGTCICLLLSMLNINNMYVSTTGYAYWPGERSWCFWRSFRKHRSFGILCTRIRSSEYRPASWNGMVFTPFVFFSVIGVVLSIALHEVIGCGRLAWMITWLWCVSGWCGRGTSGRSSSVVDGHGVQGHDQPLRSPDDRETAEDVRLHELPAERGAGDWPAKQPAAQRDGAGSFPTRPAAASGRVQQAPPVLSRPSVLNNSWKMNAMQNNVLTSVISNSEQTAARSTNPFADDNLQGFPQFTTNGENPQPTQDFLKLPAASPYDNFLRAAGCWVAAAWSFQPQDHQSLHPWDHGWWWWWCQDRSSPRGRCVSISSFLFFFLQMKRERKKTVCPRVRPALEAQPDSTPPFSTYVQLYIRTRVQVGRSLCPCFFLAKRNV